MKKIIAVIAILTLSIGVFYSCGKKEDGVVKIGAILSLTGSADVWGKNAKMGMDIALEEINSQQSKNSKKLQIIYEDCKSDPSTAVTALNKLISVDKVNFIIGDISSSNVLAMAPIAQKNKVILLSPGASNPEISNAGDYIFRNWQSDALEGEVDANYAFDSLKIKKAAILFINNAYGKGLSEVFQKHFSRLGGSIILNESYEQNQKDMKTQLVKINETKPELLYLPGYPGEMATVLTQMEELKINLPILSVQAFDDPSVKQIANKTSLKIIYSIPTPADSSEKIVKNFRNKYLAKYQIAPGVTSDTGYDAVYILYECVKNGAISPEEVQSKLVNLKNFPGASGSITFDKNGDIIKPFIFIKTF